MNKAFGVILAAVVMIGVVEGVKKPSDTNTTDTESYRSTPSVTIDLDDYAPDTDIDTEPETTTVDSTPTICSACGGTGKIQRTGYAPNLGHNDWDTSYEYDVVCSVCGGSGYWD